MKNLVIVAVVCFASTSVFAAGVKPGEMKDPVGARAGHESAAGAAKIGESTSVGNTGLHTTTNMGQSQTAPSNILQQETAKFTKSAQALGKECGDATAGLNDAITGVLARAETLGLGGDRCATKAGPALAGRVAIVDNAEINKFNNLGITDRNNDKKIDAADATPAELSIVADAGNQALADDINKENPARNMTAQQADANLDQTCQLGCDYRSEALCKASGAL
jgi:hypothetical protein